MIAVNPAITWKRPISMSTTAAKVIPPIAHPDTCRSPLVRSFAMLALLSSSIQAPADSFAARCRDPAHSISSFGRRGRCRRSWLPDRGPHDRGPPSRTPRARPMPSAAPRLPRARCRQGVVDLPGPGSQTQTDQGQDRRREDACADERRGGGGAHVALLDRDSRDRHDQRKPGGGEDREGCTIPQAEYPAI